MVKHSHMISEVIYITILWSDQQVLPIFNENKAFLSTKYTPIRILVVEDFGVMFENRSIYLCISICCKIYYRLNLRSNYFWRVARVTASESWSCLLNEKGMCEQALRGCTLAGVQSQTFPQEICQRICQRWCHIVPEAHTCEQRSVHASVWRVEWMGGKAS